MSMDNWIYEDHEATLETLVSDFSKVPESRFSIVPILTRENQCHFGDFIEYKGVRTSYLGAFTKKEEEFLKSVYSQFNGNIRTMRFIHTIDKNGLINGADIHLFSGSSKLGTFRVDINPKSNATHILSVQKILNFLISKNIKFDLILLDPPYNAKYDKQYKTHGLNKIDDGSHFLEWLIRRVIKVLNPYGLLVSKNWRSIKPKYCKFICGVFSKYGGFRRNTVLKVWQYFPTFDKSKTFNFSIRQHKNSVNQKNTKFLKWITGVKNVWNDKEIGLLLKNINLQTVNKCLVISEDNEFNIVQNYFNKINITLKTPQEFTQFKLKKDRNTDSYIIPKVSVKYDLIIVNECNTIGGNTVLTSALKILVRQSLTKNGYIVMKSYFDPVLEKDKTNKITKKNIVSNVKLQDEAIILYENFEKISSLHIYRENSF